MFHVNVRNCNKLFFPLIFRSSSVLFSMKIAFDTKETHPPFCNSRFVFK